MQVAKRLEGVKESEKAAKRRYRGKQSAHAACRLKHVNVRKTMRRLQAKLRR